MFTLRLGNGSINFQILDSRGLNNMDRFMWINNGESWLDIEGISIVLLWVR